VAGVSTFRESARDAARPTFRGPVRDSASYTHLPHLEAFIVDSTFKIGPDVAPGNEVNPRSDLPTPQTNDRWISRAGPSAADGERGIFPSSASKDPRAKS